MLGDRRRSSAFALLSARVRAFWARVRQGLTILRDRRRYFREVWLVQFGGWVFRFTAFWFLLEAFNVGGSVRNVLLVLGVNAVAALVPFTPGGAGVQQALLVKVFAGTAAGATVAAYSVGQQIAIAAIDVRRRLRALVFIFRFRSFKEVIAAGRASATRRRRRPSGRSPLRPWRASRTSVTASGKTVAITERICWACCSVVPWMLTRLIAATVMSTASLIALSAQASVWAACICSAISCMRRWKSGSLKKPPKPSMAQLYWWQRPWPGGRALAACGARDLARVLGLPARDRPAQRAEGERRPGAIGQPEGEEAVGEHGDDRGGGVDAEGDERADHAAVDAADAAGERERVGEHADEVADDEDADGGGGAEGLEARPQARRCRTPTTSARRAGPALPWRIRRRASRTPSPTGASQRRSRPSPGVTSWARRDQRDHGAAEDRGHDRHRERAAAGDERRCRGRGRRRPARPCRRCRAAP